MCPPAARVGVQLFFCLPGAEAAVTANDWALFRQIMGSSCSQQQLDMYVQQLSQPGEWRVHALVEGAGVCPWQLGRGCNSCNSPPLHVSLSCPHTQSTPRSAVQVRSRPH